MDLCRPKTGVHILVTGIRNAVSKTLRRRLKRLVQIGTHPNVVRYELAKANRFAASSPIAQNGISTACLAYSLDNSGGGYGEVHGDVLGPLIPRQILYGIDMTKMMAPILASNPNLKLVQSAFSTGESHQATLKEGVDCEPRFNTPIKELATIKEVGSINDCHLSMNGINSLGCIVGQLERPIGTRPEAFVWPSEREFVMLGTLGGPSSNALSINDGGQVTGTADLDQSTKHAFIWDQKEGMKDLGTLGGRDSFAQSINGHCQVVGTSSVGAGETKQETRRAFLWTEASGMLNLGAHFEAWSQGVAINSAGVVLGMRLRGIVICGFVWSPELGFVDIVGQSERAFFPCAINDSGLVVGEGDDSSGKRRAFIWTRETGLRQIAVPDDFHPSDVDVYGTVVGNVHSRPWHRPHLYSNVTGKSQALPFVDEHHTVVGRMGRNQVILGAAWKSPGKHSHPLTWSLNSIPLPLD